MTNTMAWGLACDTEPILVLKVTRGRADEPRFGVKTLFGITITEHGQRVLDLGIKPRPVVVLDRMRATGGSKARTIGLCIGVSADMKNCPLADMKMPTSGQ
jgi:hypothetical protein